MVPWTCCGPAAGLYTAVVDRHVVVHAAAGYTAVVDRHVVVQLQVRIRLSQHCPLYSSQE